LDHGNEEEPTEKPEEKTERSASPKRESSASKLDKRVQDVVSMIFDIKAMEHTLVELEFDVKKMPLGKLSKKTVKDGYAILKEIEQVLNSSKKDSSTLAELSSKFYTVIPHNFGRNVPPPIKTSETLKQKMQLLEAMADIEIAQSLIKQAEKSDSNDSVIDQNYQKLKCALRPIEKNTEEFKLISDFVMANQEKKHLELLELFTVEREGEGPRYETKKDLGNRKLLWHGSRVTNFAGILSQGLRIAPPEAPASGYRFGKGLYFADIMTLSSNYCRVQRDNPYGFMLLCDTALGKLYECAQDKYMEKPPAGYDSTWALGRIEPDPKGDVKTPDGCVVPSGKITPVANKSSVSCHEHQYICYHEAQTQIKYMLKLKWKF